MKLTAFFAAPLALPLALVAASCTTQRLRPDPILPEPAPDASLSSTTASAPPPRPEPRAFVHACAMTGCDSGVSFRVHLNETPAALGTHGSFRMCHAAQCWDGTFVPPPSPGALTTCSVPSSFPLTLRCNVQPDVHGARFDVTAVEGQFIDGDRISLRVVVGGHVVVDVTRHVTYDADNPNGPECGPTCDNAMIELWPGSRSDVTCSNAVCAAVVRIDSILPMTREGAGVMKVTACKNGDCKTSDMIRLWRWDDVNDRPIPESQGGGGVREIDGATAMVSASSGSSRYAPYNVKTEFTGDPRDYKNGDTYSVELSSQTGQVLLSEQRVVTAYDETEPGGPGCSPVTCKSKSF